MSDQRRALSMIMRQHTAFFFLSIDMAIDIDQRSARDEYTTST